MSLKKDGPDYEVRRLSINDLKNDRIRVSLFETLENLTAAPIMSREDTIRAYVALGRQQGDTFVAINDRGILATATLLTENTPFGKIGYIEDVVRKDGKLRQEERFRGLGRAVMQAAIDLAREKNCNRLTLDCDDGVRDKFYNKLGFTHDPNELQVAFYADKGSRIESGFNLGLLGQGDSLEGYKKFYPGKKDRLDSFFRESLLYDNLGRNFKQGSSLFVLRDGGDTLGAVSVKLEQKYIHGDEGGKVLHFHSVNSRDDEVREELLKGVVNLMYEEGCYKAIGRCSQKELGLYESVGFSEKENPMWLKL